jgi:hypothetical protein
VQAQRGALRVGDERGIDEELELRADCDGLRRGHLRAGGRREQYEQEGLGDHTCGAHWQTSIRRPTNACELRSVDRAL